MASIAPEPATRPFPFEAVVVFPLVGPPVLGFGMALAYAVLLMVSLSLGGILAIPVYGVFWTMLLAPMLAPPLLLAGLLYAFAVRRFAPPRLTTALAAAVAAVSLYLLAALPGARLFALDLERLHITRGGILPAAIGCVIAVIPGWWLTRALRRWRGRP
jgi:hypothetical protein